MEIDKNQLRTTLRLPPDLSQQVKYWAKKKGMSVNDYLLNCIYCYINRENGDYDLPTLEIARLNQLIDYIQSLSENVKSLESVVTDGFGGLMNLVAGDSYLLDEDGSDVNG